MKNCILILVMGILLSPIAFGQAPTVIDNSVINIVFDHDKGGINALTYKYGSNRNILDPYWNQGGLGRLGLLGDPWVDETGSIVTDYDIQTDHASFTYENPLYGTKSFDISWSASGGVEITMTFNFDVADDDRENRGTWEPGGNNDGNDYITVLKADESEQTFHYWYPGPWTLIWEGDAYGTIVWDADYDERIGYRTDCYIHTRFANGASADGPYRRMDQAGTYILYFAVKNSAAFDGWFNSFTKTGKPCTGAENRPPTAHIEYPVKGDTFGISLPFSLYGYGVDPEDGELPDENLSWFVDNMDVGSGSLIRNFHINTLGEHTIKLEATDSQDLQGSSQITVHVIQDCDYIGHQDEKNPEELPEDPSAGKVFHPKGYIEHFDFSHEDLILDKTRWIARTSPDPEDPGPQRWVTDKDHLDVIHDPQAQPDQKAIQLRVTPRPSLEEFSHGAEITSEDYFGYGTYTIRMKLVKGDIGLVAGAFTYRKEQKIYSEIDFEILTRLFNCPKGELLCTSWHKPEPDRKREYFVSQVNSQFLASYHEYTFEWLPNNVTYYIDGFKIGENTKFVPWERARFHFNIWSGNSFSGILGEGGEGVLTIDYFCFMPYVSGEILEVTGLCPVNLKVTDPNGRISTLDSTEIPRTIHGQLDINGDGEIDERAVIISPVPGQYVVDVMPKVGSAPDETYTLLAILENDTTVLALDEMIVNIPPQGYIFSTLDTGCVYGVASANSVGLLGVPVDLYDSTGTIVASTASDDSGFYQFPSLNNGYYLVSISTPLGYQADAETKQIKVRGLPHEVNFELTRLEIVPSQRSMGYWKHQVSANLFGLGHPEESGQDLSNYMNLIRTHFNENLVNPVEVFQVPQPANHTDSLESLQQLLTVNRGGTMNDKAKQQIVALMLNVVSLKLHQTTPISVDGATVSQAITYCYELITDSDLTDDETAKEIADQINNGILTAAGTIPLSTPSIMYKGPEYEIAQTPDLPNEFSLSQNYPNPFNPVCNIEYAIPSECKVELSIHNILGRKVKLLVDGYEDPGYKSVKWDGKDDQGQEVTSGVYLCRIHAGEFVQTKKMLLIK